MRKNKPVVVASRKRIDPELACCRAPSETIPDQVKSMEEYLQMRNQGIPTSMYASTYADTDLSDIPTDKVELAEFRRNLSERIGELQNQFHVASKQLEEEQRKEEFEKRVQAEAEKRVSTAQAEP